MKNREIHIYFVDTVNNNDTANVAENVADVAENVTDRISKIIALIKENNRISTVKMATILSVSKRTILRDIDKLKQSGLISREGDEKTGHWKLNNQK